MHSMEYVGQRKFNFGIRRIQFECHLLRPQARRTTRAVENG
jgi:hypothetical protein